MIPDKLNSDLISAMKERLSADLKLARFLMDKLCIGKEAVYCRLRGEVPFTIAEAAVISREMGVSLDQLVGSSTLGNAVFNLNVTTYEDPYDTCTDIVERYLAVFRRAVKTPGSVFATATNIIPKYFFFRYEGLSRFMLFKWIYQRGKSSHVKNYGDVVLPNTLLARQKEYISVSRQVSLGEFIISDDFLRSLVNDVKYFAGVGLITPPEVAGIRSDLNIMLDEMESLAVSECNSLGNEVQIYVSNIHLDACYGYLESENTELGMMRVYSINSITSTDRKVFDGIKVWIQSVKKFTTLITHSGEMQRIRFFKSQRDMVEQL